MNYCDDLMLISCSNYCGYFEYVKGCEIMLLLYENPCLVMMNNDLVGY